MRADLSLALGPGRAVRQITEPRRDSYRVLTRSTRIDRTTDNFHCERLLSIAPSTVRRPRVRGVYRSARPGPARTAVRVLPRALTKFSITNCHYSPDRFRRLSKFRRRSDGGFSALTNVSTVERKALWLDGISEIRHLFFPTGKKRVKLHR